MTSLLAKCPPSYLSEAPSLLAAGLLFSPFTTWSPHGGFTLLPCAAKLLGYCIAAENVVQFRHWKRKGQNIYAVIGAESVVWVL